MKIILIVGVTISMLGLLGLVICISKGLKVRRLERLGTHSGDELKKLLGQLSVMNILSLSLSFVGLLMVVISIVLNS
jgi:hypothetical protein